MREIKFRGKCTGRGWVYGDLVTRRMPQYDSDTMIFDGEAWFPVRPRTVSQFTGMHDRNGAPIYEGDVATNGKRTGVVRWMQNECCYQIAPCVVSLTSRCEVLGNIYEHIDLIELIER